MPAWLERLLANPVALVGVLRALALAAVPYGLTWLSPATVDGWLNALAILLPFLSLIFTGASAAAHAADVQRALYQDPPAPRPPGGA